MSAKNIAIGVGVALAAAGGAYGAGRFQGNQRVEAAEQRATAAASASASAVTNANAFVDIERGKVSRLEARRRLHLAILALEDKNFGIAEDHVVAARGHLAAAKGSDAELQKLRTDLDAFKIQPAEDVAESRKKLVEWCNRLDALMPPTKP